MENFLPVLLGGSWATGVNMYLTAVGLGLANRLGWVHLPGDLTVLSHPLVMLLAGVLFGVNFFSDKIPFIDHISDMVHTFIRPTAGAAMGYLATAHTDPVIQTGAALLTGSIALGSHLTKSSTRAAVNSSTAGIGGPAASVAEDAGVFGMLYLIIKHPIIASIVAILLIAISIWLLRKFFRFVKRLFSPLKKEEVAAEKKVPAVS